MKDFLQQYLEALISHSSLKITKSSPNTGDYFFLSLSTFYFSLLTFAFLLFLKHNPIMIHHFPFQAYFEGTHFKNL